MESTMEIHPAEGCAMSEATTISAMLKSVAHGPAWHGYGAMEILEGIAAADAARMPLDDVHSIWEILLHMIAWQDYTIAVVDGADGQGLEGAEDWPPAPDPGTEEEWEAALQRFEGGGRDIRERILHFDDARLREPIPGRDFPMKILLHGIVHHNVYHAGQIALLKKALGIR